MQVAYQRILQLTYVDELLAAMRKLFIQFFGPFLTTFVQSLHATSGAKVTPAGGTETTVSWNFASAFEKWDSVFNDLLRSLETKAAQVRRQPSTLLSVYISDDSLASRSATPASDTPPTRLSTAPRPPRTTRAQVSRSSPSLMMS